MHLGRATARNEIVLNDLAGDLWEKVNADDLTECILRPLQKLGEPEVQVRASADPLILKTTPLVECRIKYFNVQNWRLCDRHPVRNGQQSAQCWNQNS